jgi:hypothetical protein
VILEFGLKKPAYRIVVNTPTTHGSIGLTTGLDPSMTLGCGGYGGNITSDNISPRHLLNIKRVAYELRPATSYRAGSSAGASPAVATAPVASTPASATPARLPQAPAIEAPTGVDASAIRRQVDTMIGARPAATTAADPAAGTVADFVCEDDVKQAIKQGRKIVIGDRTIVTPSARDLAEAQRVFVQSGWPRN